MTQPGALWRRLKDQAEDLGDAIGSNDPGAANTAYALAGHFKVRYETALAQHNDPAFDASPPSDDE